MSTQLGYCLLDSAGRVVAQAGERQPFYAASTMKVAVMAGVARLVDTGVLGWQDAVPVRSVFPSAVAGAAAFAMAAEDHDVLMPPDGETMTVVELVRAMIARSSNEATNLLVPLVGWPALAAVQAQAGAIGCRIERLIGDTAAAEVGATNEVTPLGLARLMRAVVTGALASPASTAVMVDALRAQQFPCIAEVLPAGTPWGSKSGWVPGIEHDVAFIGAPTRPALRVLAVCTRGYAGREARPEIHRVSRALLVDLDVA